MLRCDFNAFRRKQCITDDKRIVSRCPHKIPAERKGEGDTASHLGRPKGEFNMKYSLSPVAARLSELIGMEVKMASDVVGESAKALAAPVGQGQAVPLSVRFHKEEEKNVRPSQRACFNGHFRNDAFGTPTAPTLQIAGVANYLPACGYLIRRKST